MKKIKRILIPLLMIMCIPLFLTGCSSNNGIYKESNVKGGRAWYVINSQNKVKSILFVNGNKVSDADGFSIFLSSFNNLSTSTVSSKIKKIISSDQENEGTAILKGDTANLELAGWTDNTPFKYSVAKNGKSETIYSPTYFKYKLTNPNVTATVNGTKYVGYDCYDENAGLRYRLVTSTNHKLGFDKEIIRNWVQTYSKRCICQ